MKKMIAIFICLSFILSACSILGGAKSTEDPVIAAMQGTLAVEQAAANIMAQTQGAISGSTDQVAPPVAAATEEPVKTDEPGVMASANMNVNCRLGPAANFPLVVSLKAGEAAAVIGKNTDNGLYWKVKLENGKECWLIADAVTVSGNSDAVAMVVSPSTPTPVPPPAWTGIWNMRITLNSWNPAIGETPFTTTMQQNGNVVSFEFTAAGNSFRVNGTVSDDGMVFNGKLKNLAMPNEWAVRMVRDPDNTDRVRGRWNIIGNTSLDGELCGSTNGAGFPSPCRP